MFYLNRALEFIRNTLLHDEQRVLAQGRPSRRSSWSGRRVDPDLTGAQCHLAAVLLEQGHMPDNLSRLRD
jgi:hypothetical protein